MSFTGPEASVKVAGTVGFYDGITGSALFDSRYMYGGWRVVSTLAERNSIPLARREEGMRVWCREDSTEYELQSDLSTWSVVSEGETGAQGFTGSQGLTGPRGETGAQGLTGVSPTINEGQIAFGGSGGEITSSANLTYTGSNFSVVTGNIGVGKVADGTHPVSVSLPSNTLNIKNAYSVLSSAQGAAGYTDAVVEVEIGGSTYYLIAFETYTTS